MAQWQGTQGTVRGCEAHVSIAQLVEAMAEELNLEPNHFVIEEIVVKDGDTLFLDHSALEEEGWPTKISVPQDPVSFGSKKWVRISLVSGEDMVPPCETNPTGIASVNIGIQGQPTWREPPVTGYQSMHAMGMLSYCARS